MNRKEKIVIIGMGYVGLTYSLYLNTKGFKVIGIEKSSSVRSKLKNGELPFFERGLSKILNNSLKNSKLKIYSNKEFESLRKSLEHCLFIISVGTPVTDKRLNYNSINSITEYLKNLVRENDSICFRSTLPIGFTKKTINNLKVKVNYCFAPERTIEGSAIDELNSLPQIFGADDNNSKKYFFEFFKSVSSEVVELENSKSAELLKLASNVYRDVVFAFSNEIAKICFDNDINSKKLIRAINFKYGRCNVALPGPVAGPCISKDAYILFENENERKYLDTSLIIKSRQLNENYIIQIIREIIEKNFHYKINVSVLGIAFKGKPLTSDIRDSYALQIIKMLNNIDKVRNIYGFDAQVFEDDFIKEKINRKYTIEECFKDDLIIIQNNQELFKNLNFERLIKNKKTKTYIIDLWAQNDSPNIDNNLTYIHL